MAVERALAEGLFGPVHVRADLGDNWVAESDIRHEVLED